MTLARWAVYTVILALTPILMRILIAILAASSSEIRWLSESDVATFGLILVITNISALEIDTSADAEWKTRQFGWSLLLVAVFATLFAITCFQEFNSNVFDRTRVLWATLVLAASSVLYSYSVWSRVAAAQPSARK